MRNFYLYILLFFLSVAAYSQKQYTVTFETLPEKMAAERRPVLIKIYTDWCAICKIQDKQVAKDIELQKILAEKYYYLECDAETKNDIVFNGKSYHHIASGANNGYHEFAALFAQGGNAYPLWAILSPEYEITGIYNGLIKSKQLTEILKQYQP